MEQSEGEAINWQFTTMEERAAFGEAVHALMQTGGWRYIDGLLRQLERDIPIEGLREQGKEKPLHSIDYYLGQVEFIQRFRENFEAAAEIVKEEGGPRKRKLGDAVLQMMRPGGAGV